MRTAFFIAEHEGRKRSGRRTRGNVCVGAQRILGTLKTTELRQWRACRVLFVSADQGVRREV